MARWRNVVTVRTLVVATALGVLIAVGDAIRAILREGPNGRTFTGLLEGDPGVLSSLATDFVIAFVLGMVLIGFGVLKLDGASQGAGTAS